MYRKQVKFKQTWMIHTTQNLELYHLYDKKPRLNYVHHVGQIVSLFSEIFLRMKRLNDAKLWIKRLPSIIILKVR